MSEFNDWFVVVIGVSFGIGLKLIEMLFGYGVIVLVMVRCEGLLESLYVYFGKCLYWLVGDVICEWDLDVLVLCVVFIGFVDYLVFNVGIVQFVDGLDSLVFEQQWWVNGVGVLNIFFVFSW